MRSLSLRDLALVGMPRGPGQPFEDFELYPVGDFLTGATGVNSSWPAPWVSRSVFTGLQCRDAFEDYPDASIEGLVGGEGYGVAPWVGRDNWNGPWLITGVFSFDTYADGDINGVDGWVAR